MLLTLKTLRTTLLFLLLNVACVFADPNDGQQRSKSQDGFVSQGWTICGEKWGTWETYSSEKQLVKRERYLCDQHHGFYEEWYLSTNMNQPQRKVEGKYYLGQRDGTWKVWHPNGKIRWISHFYRGTPQGIAQEWFSHSLNNQQIMKLSGEYHVGKKVGTWKAYYPDGAIELEQTYVDGQLHGVAKEYYAYGGLRSITSFTAGIQKGISRSFYPNGRQKTLTAYSNNRPHGKFSSYYPNGKLASLGEYKDGIPVGQWFWFTKNGKTRLASSTFIEGSGTMVAFYSSGQQQYQCHYLNGLKEGCEVLWYPSGSVKSQTSYKNGKIDGWHQEFYENGSPMSQGLYQLGHRQGHFQWWYGNEQIRLSTSYSDDVLDGPWTEYYENGVIKGRGLWIQGTQQGLWEVFDRYGNLLTSNNL